MIERLTDDSVIGPMRNSNCPIGDCSIAQSIAEIDESPNHQ
jgi:hypothetical protein